jgi:hypothetical protein
MKLIGSKDYYDGITGFDSDARLTFVRNNFLKAIPSEFKYTSKSHGRHLNVIKSSVDSILIREIKVIFCGKLYQGAYYTSEYLDTDKGKFISKYITFWNKKSLLSELEDKGMRLTSRDWSTPYFRGDVTLENIDEYFTPADLPKSDLEHVISQNIVSVIGIETKYSYDWYENTDGLKQIGFASVVDPWQAYQQIEMWIGSQLAKEEDKMVKLSDNELINKHGFDKVSFRNTHHAGKPRCNK